MISTKGWSGLICKPNSTCYITIIDVLCKAGLVDMAKELFLEMKSSEITPNVVLYSSLIHGLYSCGDSKEAEDVYKEIQCSYRCSYQVWHK